MERNVKITLLGLGVLVVAKVVQGASNAIDREIKSNKVDFFGGNGLSIVTTLKLINNSPAVANVIGYDGKLLYKKRYSIADITTNSVIIPPKGGSADFVINSRIDETELQRAIKSTRDFNVGRVLELIRGDLSTRGKIIIEVGGKRIKVPFKTQIWLS